MAAFHKSALLSRNQSAHSRRRQTVYSPPDARLGPVTQPFRPPLAATYELWRQPISPSKRASLQPCQAVRFLAKSQLE
eukprot:CAMPEP_0183355438 /NCGR_PEP_ID=MMETSP0164_2-20130417/40376_1 /TAXON_ID=221442 /ORGANISM="Coccolithus pelagicus ssp braarudi, Strain PLY182g" /LENGTH=77 /DNA_ID=CAMNT_0025528551 /DNA_START=214 /DNA_END=444 /DNA_ORIENTATION=-